MPPPGETELVFPEGLVDVLRHFSQCQIRRRVYVFLDGDLLPCPDGHYLIVSNAIHLFCPISPTQTVTVAIPSADERWYYSHDEGWGRL